MSIIATAALLLLLAALYLALMCAAERGQKARTPAPGARRRAHAAACGAGGKDAGNAYAGGVRRTRHLSPHRAAIDRMKGKEVR